MEKNLSKKSISRVITYVIMIAVVLMSVSALMACGKGTSSIVIKDSDMPRTTYVQGQDLDLSDGVLTVISKKGGESVLPLTDPAISISGYDKSAIGKQTVTVTYKDMTTTFEVNVVSRMVADGYKTEYFINEAFDYTKGKLKITKDDGKTTSVTFDNEFVTVTFNNTVAGDATVSAVYDDNQGTKYETTFTVKCYEIGDVTFVKPNKTVYQSHDTELAVGGGYFNVKAKNANYSIPVTLTAEMTKGFDPTLATEAHRKTPLSQTITCTYGGKNFEFTISIFYSSVSVVINAANALKDVKINDRNFALDDTLSAIAVDAATEYFKLTNDKKALISEEDVLAVMRPAAFCVTKAFKASSEKYSKVFVIDEATGDILINAQTYEDLSLAIEEFNKKDDPFNVLADVLSDMKKEFADVFLFTEKDDKGEPVEYTMSTYIKAPGEDQRTFYKNLFEYMLSVSEKLSSVPDDWSLDSKSDKYLGNYATAITDTFNFIVKSAFIGTTFNGPYNSISSWRENDDFYEIIYNYYINVADEDVKKDFASKLVTNKGIMCPLPGELQDWYTYITWGYGQIVNNMVVTKNGETTYYALYDTTLYMYYYNKAMELTNNIIDGDNDLYKSIYSLIGGEMMLYNNLDAPYSYDSLGNYHPHGFLYMTMLAPDSARVNKLRESYMEIVTLYFENSLDPVAHKDKFEKMFSDMAELTPAELYAFISSISFLYGNSDTYVLDYSERIYSYFTLFIALYEKEYVDNTNTLPFRQLLKAMELCAQIGAKATVDEFRSAMNELKNMLNGNDLSDADKAAFMEIAGDCYNKYLSICNTLSAPNDFAGYEDEYNELKNTIKDFFTIHNILFNTELSEEELKETSKYYILLFALSEKAIALRESLNDAPEEVLNSLYVVKYALNGSNEMTIETAYAYLTSVFYGQLIRQNVSITQNFSISFWALYYSSTTLREFMADLASPLMAFYNDQTVDIEAVRALMSDFREMSASELALFAMFGNTYYYDMLLDTFSVEGNDAHNTFVKAILQSELCYAEYIKDTTDASRIEFFAGEKGMGAAIAAYNALGADGQNNLDQALKDIYNFYKGIYDEIKSSESDNG